MSDHTQDPSALVVAPIPVPFRGTTLSLIDRDGEPFAAMRPIVEAMGMDWRGQHVKIKARYTAVVEEISTTGSDGKRYAMTCLPLRKLAGWLMTIHPNKVRADLREQILAYQAECDDALWAYWTQGQATRTQAIPAPAPVLPATEPQPADPITPEVRAAINRKAHALSLDAFDRNREYLEAWLRRQPDGRDPIAALERVHALDLDHGQHLLVNFQTLYQTTSRVAAMQSLLGAVMESIGRLEQDTGRRLYGRGTA